MQVVPLEARLVHEGLVALLALELGFVAAAYGAEKRPIDVKITSWLVQVEFHLRPDVVGPAGLEVEGPVALLALVDLLLLARLVLVGVGVQRDARREPLAADVAHHILVGLQSKNLLLKKDT